MASNLSHDLSQFWSAVWLKSDLRGKFKSKSWVCSLAGLSLLSWLFATTDTDVCVSIDLFYCTISVIFNHHNYMYFFAYIKNEYVHDMVWAIRLNLSFIRDNKYCYKHYNSIFN